MTNLHLEESNAKAKNDILQVLAIIGQHADRRGGTITIPIKLYLEALGALLAGNAILAQYAPEMVIEIALTSSELACMDRELWAELAPIWERNKPRGS